MYIQLLKEDAREFISLIKSGIFVHESRFMSSASVNKNVPILTKQGNGKMNKAQNEFKMIAILILSLIVQKDLSILNIFPF